jgi:hypothetical protein
MGGRNRGLRVRNQGGAGRNYYSNCVGLGRLQRARLVAIDILVGVDTLAVLDLHRDVLDPKTTAQGSGHRLQYDLSVGAVIAIRMQGHYRRLTGQ